MCFSSHQSHSSIKCMNEIKLENKVEHFFVPKTIVKISVLENSPLVLLWKCSPHLVQLHVDRLPERNSFYGQQAIFNCLSLLLCINSQSFDRFGVQCKIAMLSFALDCYCIRSGYPVSLRCRDEKADAVRLLLFTVPNEFDIRMRVHECHVHVQVARLRHLFCRWCCCSAEKQLKFLWSREEWGGNKARKNEN